MWKRLGRPGNPRSRQCVNSTRRASRQSDSRRPRRMGRHDGVVLQNLRLRLGQALAAIQEAGRRQRDTLKLTSDRASISANPSHSQRRYRTYRLTARSEPGTILRLFLQEHPTTSAGWTARQPAAPSARAVSRAGLRSVISPRIGPTADHHDGQQEET